MVERYRHAINTQREEDFLPLWNEQATCTLISPSGCFTGIAGLETQVYNRVGEYWKLTHVHYSMNKNK